MERVGLITNGIVKAIGTVGELKSRISKQVRLELKLNPSVGELDIEILNNNRFPLISQGERQWIIHVEEDFIQDAVNFVVEQVGMKNLNDFRILTPTLEDAYIKLSGGKEKNEIA
ncbi:MAG: hypothetical protein KAX49_06265 [Halanaerobiales bacterium]|nr:hypothetical protein [Halanaerobiales bacterium]